MMITVLELLLLISLFAGSVIRSKCESQPASPMKCLMNLDQARQVLGSTIPPINNSRMTDNYYNISRALYPLIDLPSLYVKVTIQFLQDYQNGTQRIEDKKKKFTWSKACSYVSVKHCDLYAMSVFSLGTILPQRRTSELTFTVPPFCKNSPYAQDDAEMKTWRYIVSTIEDITVSPKISDPRINTVACVVKGHEGDDEQQIEYPKDCGTAKIQWPWDFCWFILSASCLTSIVVWCYLQSLIRDIMREYRSNMDKPDHKKKRMLAGTFLTMTVFLFVTSILTTGLSLPINHQKVYARFYVIAYFAFLGITLVVCMVVCVCLCGLNANDHGDKCRYKVGYCLLFPSLFMTVHHLLWVLCGVISEPYWATPIFLIECLFSFSMMFCIYLYEKDVVVEQKVINNKCCVLLHLGFSWLAFNLILSIVAFVGHGHIVGVTTASVIEVIITISFIWLVKNSGLHLKSFEGKKKNGDKEEETPLQNIQTTAAAPSTGAGN